MSNALVCVHVARILPRDGSAFVQATYGQSDVMSLTMHPDGWVRFSRSPGVVSRPEGADYRAMCMIAMQLRK